MVLIKERNTKQSLHFLSLICKMYSKSIYYFKYYIVLNLEDFFLG